MGKFGPFELCRCNQLLPRSRLSLGQSLEVLVDRLPVVSRVVAIKNIAGTRLGLGRQSTPAGAVAGVAVGHIAWPLASANRAVLGRVVGLITTTRAVATARSRTALLLEFFDDRIQ